MSRTTPKKLTASLLASGVRLFAVIATHSLGYRNRTPEERTPEELAASSNLDGPVEKSGGSLFGPIEWEPSRHLAHVPTLREQVPLAEALTRFYAGILDSDLIVVQPPLGARQDSEWKLHLSKPVRQKLPGARIEYPVILTSCEERRG